MTKHSTAALMTGVLLAVAGSAMAHTAWLEAAGTAGDYVLLFGGHEGKLERYAPEKLKSVDAYDASGKPLQVARTVRDDGVHVAVRGTPALLAVHFDNGTWSRGADGKSVEKPVNQNPGAREGTRAIKYSKTIAAWAPAVARPLGQPFEVVPLSARKPRAGQPWPVRVLIDGTPAVDIEVSRGEQGQDSVRTNAEGVAAIVPKAGTNRFWAGKRTPVSGEPGYTQLSVEYLLVFIVN